MQPARMLRSEGRAHSAVDASETPIIEIRIGGLVNDQRISAHARAAPVGYARVQGNVLASTHASPDRQRDVLIRPQRATPELRPTTRSTLRDVARDLRPDIPREHHSAPACAWWRACVR